MELFEYQNFKIGGVIDTNLKKQNLSMSRETEDITIFYRK